MNMPSLLALQKEERETPGCDSDDGLIIAPISAEATAGISLHRAFLCGFIVLIALMSISLTCILR